MTLVRAQVPEEIDRSPGEADCPSVVFGLSAAATAAAFRPALDSFEEVATAAPGRDESSPDQSFEAFYIENFERLVRLAFVLTGSKEVAEDLVQEAFVRMHGHFPRIEAPDRYARQVVVNACRSYFRKKGRERDKRPLLYVIDGSSDQAHPGELTDVLLTLPHRQRAAIVLRFYADLNEAEIADALGCRPGTVGSLIHRGLERLRKALSQ